MIKLVKTLTILSFAIGTMALISGLFGEQTPAADSIAVFRHYAVAGLLFSMFGFAVWRQQLLTILSLVLALYGGFSMRHQLSSPAPVSGFTLMQHNINFRNDARNLVDYALANDPDVITLQEVTTLAIPQLAAMRGRYPYQVVCPFASIGGVAILSKFKFTNPQGEGCREGLGMVSAGIEIPAGEVTVVSLHLSWPWPYEQTSQLERLLPELQNLSGPVFIGGDFNMVPWSQIMASLESATRTEMIGGLRFTKSLFFEAIQLPIDHVLAPKDWPVSAQVGPRLGSDHNSVLASIALN